MPTTKTTNGVGISKSGGIPSDCSVSIFNSGVQAGRELFGTLGRFRVGRAFRRLFLSLQLRVANRRGIATEDLYHKVKAAGRGRFRIEQS